MDKIRTRIHIYLQFTFSIVYTIHTVILLAKKPYRNIELLLLHLVSGPLALGFDIYQFT